MIVDVDNNCDWKKQMMRCGCVSVCDQQNQAVIKACHRATDGPTCKST